MPKLKVDNRKIEVREGTTILEAAEKLGIAIPTMCSLKGYEPHTSCMVCVVELEGSESLVPACGAQVLDGMSVKTASEKVLEARKTSLELLLSEHAGDCLAPCQRACRMNIDIPLMIRLIKKGYLEQAGRIVQAVSTDMCRECDRQCEKACRRRMYDESVAIYRLVKFVEDIPGGDIVSEKISPIEGAKFSSVMKNIRDDEMSRFLKDAASYGQIEPEKPEIGYTRDEALKEALRCFECDCGKKDDCRLREHSGDYRAKQTAYSGQRMGYEKQVSKDYIFEQGKCIKCGICTRISENKGVACGFNFTGRGFATRLGVAFGRFDNEELAEIIGEIIENCPTGAIVHNE